MRHCGGRGLPFGISDAGYKAINSLRMEKRYVYWSADISPDGQPAGSRPGLCGFSQKGRFPRAGTRCSAQKQRGLTRRLECFALEDPLPVYGGEAMIAGGKVIGMTTSGDFGHSCRSQSLVLGYVPVEHAGQQCD